MGSIAIGEALFTKTQRRVLALLYGCPGRQFYTNEIVRRLGAGRGAVRRELERLTAAGLLVASRDGIQLYYGANSNSPVYFELLGIVEKSLVNTENEGGAAAKRIGAGQRGGGKGMSKHAGDEILIGGEFGVSRSALQQAAKRYYIRRLCLFGSAARGELGPDSDIDLLVEFEKGRSPSLAGLLDIQAEFSKLFDGRKVDVATASILNNPYRKRAIEKDMEELYAA